MDEVGYGLLDRELLRRVSEEIGSKDVGVGVIYVQMPRGSETPVDGLTIWTKTEKRIFWHCRMHPDYFFFVRSERRDGHRDALKALESDMRQLLGADCNDSNATWPKPAFGAGAVTPGEPGRSIESAVYRAIKEAVSHALRTTGPIGGINPLYAGGGMPKGVDKSLALQIGSLAAPIPTFHRSTPVSEVADFFESDPKAQAAVIVDGGKPVGLIMKEKLYRLLAGKFGIPLYWNRPVEKMMDSSPLTVPAEMSLEQVSQLAMARDFQQLYDVVTVTRNGQFVGAASIRSILESITMLRTEAARLANPLTGLPGNEAIQREMVRRIEARRPFAVIYADLDYFKWFNDFFGFRKGDELIRYTAEVLGQTAALSGGRSDFVGHIGGDDFIVMTEAEDPETVCRQVIWRFDGGVQAFYEDVEVREVSDRNGNSVAREGVTISLCLIQWDGERAVTPEQFSEQSARLKKQAKRLPGSVLVSGRIGDYQHGEIKR